MNNFLLQKGQSLVELLIAMGLAAVLLPALLTGFATTRAGRAQQDQRQQATLLVQESREAVRVIKEKGWGSFAINGTYHPVVSGTTWVFLSGSEQINGITRQILISDVYRDPGGAIVTSGGAIDLSTKQIVTTASWNSPFPNSVAATEYVTRYVNRQYTQTSAADFNAGTKTGVTVTNESGGEVQLGAGGQGDWCRPGDFIAGQLDLPKQGVADAIYAIEGQVAVGTGENASGISFANVAISNTDPPVAQISGTFDGYKTNGIFSETNYAYIATDSNQKEVVIIDLTQKDANNKYPEAGYFNVPSEKDAKNVFVSANIGYVIAGDRLYSFDLSAKTGSRPILDSDGLKLEGAGTRVVVVGTYAYVTIKESNKELQIIDVSNPTNLSAIGYADVTGKDAKDVFVNTTGTRAYIVTGKSDSQKEFFIINVTGKTGSQPLIGSYEANGMNPKAVTVVPGNRAIIVGKEAEEYQVIDIITESSPTRCGGLNIDDVKGINGIASVLEADGDAYSYIMTGDHDSELKIIEGGPGGQFATSGTFESQTFDASVSAQFNSFAVTQIVPSQTSLTYQVGIAHAQNGSCSGVSYTFVGPDITSTTYFATGSALPMSADGVGFENPGQCFRYRAYVSSSETSQSPVLYDIRFNYSP